MLLNYFDKSVMQAEGVAVIIKMQRGKKMPRLQKDALRTQILHTAVMPLYTCHAEWGVADNSKVTNNTHLLHNDLPALSPHAAESHSYTCHAHRGCCKT
jgi:hypothetical protein